MSDLRFQLEWSDGKWAPPHKQDHLISSDNQGTHTKKTKQTSPDNDTLSRPSKKLKEGNGADTSSHQEACLDTPSNTLPSGFGAPTTTGINSSKQPMAVKPHSFSQREEVESNQFGGGDSSKQKGRRGRPPKLLPVRKQNREVAADKMIVKDFMKAEVGSPATGVKEKLVCGLPKQINNSSHMMKTPLVKKDSHNVCTVKAAEGFKKDRLTKEVQKKIIKSPSANDVSDDQPLSTWFEGMHSQTTVNGSNISLGRNVEKSTEGVRGQKLAGAVNGEIEAVPSEIQRLPFVKNTPLWRAVESMEVFQRMPQKPHFRDLESFNEIYREGLAVACMVNFSSLVESTGKLQVDDPRSKIESKLKTLVELEESHGFDVKLVRDRLNELLLLKDRHGVLQNQYKEVESNIKEHNVEISKIDEENGEMMKKLRELEETHTLIMAKKEKNDSEIASLESKSEGINAAIRNIGREYVEDLAAALP